MEFKNSKLIYIVDDTTYYLSCIEELNEIVLGKTNNEQEKYEKMLEIAKTLSFAYDIDIITVSNIQEFSYMILKYIILDNETLYYTTLASNGLIKIYEREDANIFLNNDCNNKIKENKEENKKDTYRYYSIGENAEEIIKRYMENNN